MPSSSATSTLLTPSVQPRIGYAGLGWIGRHGMNAVAESGLAVTAGLCDPAADLSDQKAAVYETFDELIASDIDAVVIATPTALHAEQAVAALERGKAVFCQKPVGRTATETRRIIDAARAHDRLLGVDLSYRFTDAMREVKRLVSNGAIGDVFAVDVVFHKAYGPDKSWFYDPKLSGGGCVIDLGTSLVDLALWTLGFPRVERVEARLFSAGRAEFDAAAAVEDFATARIDLARGVAVSFSCSWNLHAGQDAAISAVFYGTLGTTAFRNVDGSVYDFVAELYEKTKTTSVTEPGDVWGGRAIVDWAAQLARNAEFDPRVEDVLRVAETIDRIYASGRRG